MRAETVREPSLPGDKIENMIPEVRPEGATGREFDGFHENDVFRIIEAVYSVFNDELLVCQRQRSCELVMNGVIRKTV